MGNKEINKKIENYNNIINIFYKSIKQTKIFLISFPIFMIGLLSYSYLSNHFIVTIKDCIFTFITTNAISSFVCIYNIKSLKKDIKLHEKLILIENKKLSYEQELLKTDNYKKEVNKKVVYGEKNNPLKKEKQRILKR